MAIKDAEMKAADAFCLPVKQRAINQKHAV